MNFLKFAGLVGIIAPIFGLSAVFTSILLCGPGCGGAEAWYEWGPGGIVGSAWDLPSQRP